MQKVMIMDHPLIQHKIGLIRRKDTGSRDFRALISEIAMYMCYEATRTQRKETGCCSDSASRSWHGGRYAGNDSGSKGRPYRSVP